MACKNNFFFTDPQGRTRIAGYKCIRGKADGHYLDEYDPEQLAMGIEVETEHTPNRALAMKIATDHLEEFPDYYTHLKKMESDLESGTAQPVKCKVCDFPVRIFKHPNKAGKNELCFCPKCGAEYRDGRFDKFNDIWKAKGKEELELWR
jgi:hypothetical protein